MLAVIVPLAFVAATAAATVFPISIAGGPVTSLTSSGVTVQANGEVPTSCTRTSSSPALTGFKVGENVTIECKQGILVTVAAGLGRPRGFTPPPFGSWPDLPSAGAVAGLPDNFGDAVPASGPYPTTSQCASAWNATAPAASRQAIGAQHPLAANVTSNWIADYATKTTKLSNGVSVTGSGGPLIAKGRECLISFWLPGARTATIRSLWKDGKAQDWNGYVSGLGRYIDTNQQLGLGGGAGLAWFSVAGDGTLIT
jgi:hypothetical protein